MTTNLTVLYQNNKGEFKSFHVRNIEDHNVNNYFEDSDLSIVHTLFLEKVDSFGDVITDIVRSQKGLVKFFKDLNVYCML